MQQLLNTALSGLTLGMVYAAFALALVLIWRSTRIVNFAQAPMAMVTTFVALVLIDAGYSYWIGFVVALLCGLLLGAVVDEHQGDVRRDHGHRRLGEVDDPGRAPDQHQGEREGGVDHAQREPTESGVEELLHVISCQNPR